MFIRKRGGNKWLYINELEHSLAANSACKCMSSSKAFSSGHFLLEQGGTMKKAFFSLPV